MVSSRSRDNARSLCLTHDVSPSVSFPGSSDSEAALRCMSDIRTNLRYQQLCGRLVLSQLG